MLDEGHHSPDSYDINKIDNNKNKNNIVINAWVWT